MDQKAFDQLDYLIFLSLVSLNRLDCLECFLFDSVIQGGEYTDIATFSVGMPKLAEAFPAVLQL